MTTSSKPKSLRIIYAEDSPAERELLFNLLSERGHLVTGVADGNLLLRGLAEETYDVIVTDNDMPHMDGLKLVRELRKINYPAKIIVTSGYLDPEQEENYRNLGVRIFLPKPSPDEKIFHAVEGV